jgi:hypothetical protein
MTVAGYLELIRGALQAGERSGLDFNELEDYLRRWSAMSTA